MPRHRPFFFAALNTGPALIHTGRWLRQIVVGLGLCPFAAPVLNNGRLRVACCAAGVRRAMHEAVVDELERLRNTPDTELATSLLVFTGGLHAFDDYLDFVDEAQALLEAADLLGEIQIASFHPAYRFAGELADAPSHYTNRSPYPTLHFIREAQLEAVLAKYPDAEAIPRRNIDTMDRLGVAQLQQMLADIAATHRSNGDSP